MAEFTQGPDTPWASNAVRAYLNLSLKYTSLHGYVINLYGTAYTELNGTASIVSFV